MLLVPAVVVAVAAVTQVATVYNMFNLWKLIVLALCGSLMLGVLTFLKFNWRNMVSDRFSSDFFSCAPSGLPHFSSHRSTASTHCALNGTGPKVKAEAPPPAAAPAARPTTSADLHGLEGLLRKPDPKMTLSLPEDAELIDQLHKLTGKMPKFAQLNPPPAAPTPAPSPSPQRMEAEAASP